MKRPASQAATVHESGQQEATRSENAVADRTTQSENAEADQKMHGENAEADEKMHGENAEAVQTKRQRAVGKQTTDTEGAPVATVATHTDTKGTPVATVATQTDTEGTPVATVATQTDMESRCNVIPRDPRLYSPTSPLSSSSEQCEETELDRITHTVD